VLDLIFAKIFNNPAANIFENRIGISAFEGWSDAKRAVFFKKTGNRI